LSSGLCSDLSGWYLAEHRQLPWRETSDPYRIWTSEIMLQQTQVNTVLPRYASWFEGFPDIASLAAADIDTVFKAWEGLGYYRRARLMHAAARQIVEQHQGRFPENFDDILNLPGIGRSTAGAIASICFRTHAPVLDGNVRRVLQRWQGTELSEKRMWQLAQQHIDGAADAGDWNQTMMELGATLCTPRNPACSNCPVSGHCASAFNVPESFTAKKIAVRDVHWQVVLYRSGRGIWLTQRPTTGIWAGLWTPPIVELDVPPASEADHIHLLTHRRLHLYAANSNAAPAGKGEWAGDLTGHALPTGIRRLLLKQGLPA